MRIVIGDVNSHARQHLVAKAARRPVDGIHHQQMIARLQMRHECRGDSGDA